jgi:hypothetical protein
MPSEGDPASIGRDGETDIAPKSPRTLYNEYLTANRYSGARKPLPTASLNDAQYSSTALMLKRTKAEMEAYNADLSVLNTVAELPTSEEVRRVVAKIFADPRNAAAISDAEWKRRETAFVRSRERFSDRVNEGLTRERQHMATEMSKLAE